MMMVGGDTGGGAGGDTGGGAGGDTRGGGTGSGAGGGAGNDVLLPPMVIVPALGGWPARASPEKISKPSES
ncbi:MAG: hypothetical protein JKX88_11130, partial [Marinicaulis sp.]|nr:hypothetical protein [Marinicaulis sp.]